MKTGIVVDRNVDLAVAQAQDILHATPLDLSCPGPRRGGGRSRRGRYRRACGVGPASAAPEMLNALFLAGVDTFRMNFSRQPEARGEPAGPFLCRDRAGRHSGGARHHLPGRVESGRHHNVDCDRPCWSARGRARTGDRVWHDPRFGAVEVRCRLADRGDFLVFLHIALRNHAAGELLVRVVLARHLEADRVLIVFARYGQGKAAFSPAKPQRQEGFHAKALFPDPSPFSLIAD